MLAFSSQISEIMGITQPMVLIVVGIGLLFFTATIIYHATRKTISATQVKLIIVQDGLWVIGSAIILAFKLFSLTVTGYILIAVVALVVADFGFLQYFGLKNYGVVGS